MPGVVAVVGASNDRRKFGNKALRAFRHKGYTVIPVNPNEREVEGTPAVASVLDIEGPVDMVTVYVPPHVGLAVLEPGVRRNHTYVALTRGRQANHAWIPDVTDQLDPVDRLTTTLQQDNNRASALATRARLYREARLTIRERARDDELTLGR